MTNSLRSEMMLFVVTLIWGATFLFTQVGLDYCPPFLYILMRFGTALLLTLIFFAKHLRRISKKTFLQGMALGLLFGGGFMLQTSALKLSSITSTAFITGLTVVITPFAYIIISRKLPKFWSAVGVVIAFTGLYIFTNPSASVINIGDVLTLISTLFWAVYITLMDKFTKHEHSFTKTVQLVFVQFIFASLLPLIGYLYNEHGQVSIVFSNVLIYSLLYNAVLASFVLTFLHTRFQGGTTPVKAALIFSLEPIFAAIVAVLFAGEVLKSHEIVGGSIMMIGVLASEVGNYYWDMYKTGRG